MMGSRCRGKFRCLRTTRSWGPGSTGSGTVGSVHPRRSSAAAVGRLRPVPLLPAGDSLGFRERPFPSARSSSSVASGGATVVTVVGRSTVVTGSACWSLFQDDDFRRSVSKPGARLPWVLQQVFGGVSGRKDVTERNYGHPR